jgi:hypothetical protein
MEIQLEEGQEATVFQAGDVAVAVDALRQEFKIEFVKLQKGAVSEVMLGKSR